MYCSFLVGKVQKRFLFCFFDRQSPEEVNCSNLSTGLRFSPCVVIEQVRVYDIDVRLKSYKF